MICKERVKLFCCEDPSLIENYYEAINDKEQTWQCHHRLEIQDKLILGKKELKEQKMYYHRPASELIFLTKAEHCKIHALSRGMTEERKQKIRNKLIGIEFSEEHKQKLKDAWVRRKINK